MVCRRDHQLLLLRLRADRRADQADVDLAGDRLQPCRTNAIWGALSWHVQRCLRAEPGGVGRATAYLAGVASVLLVGILGNLDAGLQVLDQLWRIGGERAAQSGGIARLAMGALGVIQGARFPPLDFWRSTRFIGPEDAGPIHEFPYFTFLYGDLHAHQIALPITVAVLAIGLNVVRSLRADRGRVPWPSLVIGGVLVGMLR